MGRHHTSAGQKENHTHHNGIGGDPLRASMASKPPPLFPNSLTPIEMLSNLPIAAVPPSPGPVCMLQHPPIPRAQSSAPPSRGEVPSSAPLGLQSPPPPQRRRRAPRGTSPPRRPSPRSCLRPSTARTVTSTDIPRRGPEPPPPPPPGGRVGVAAHDPPHWPDPVVISFSKFLLRIPKKIRRLILGKHPHIQHPRGPPDPPRRGSEVGWGVWGRLRTTPPSWPTQFPFLCRRSRSAFPKVRP